MYIIFCYGCLALTELARLGEPKCLHVEKFAWLGESPSYSRSIWIVNIIPGD